MTYVIIRCPHCNSIIRQTTSGEYSWGSPLKVCPRCNEIYIDNYYHEVAIEGFSSTDQIRSSWWMLLVPIILSVLYARVSFNGILIAIGLAILMILGVSYQRIKNKEEMKVEMKHSLERLSDYNYALALKKAGYDVPDKYLANLTNSGHYANYAICIFDATTHTLRKEMKDVDVTKFPPAKFADNDTYYAIETFRDGKKVRVYYTKENWDKQCQVEISEEKI